VQISEFADDELARGVRKLKLWNFSQVLKRRCAVTGGIGLGEPQLHAMERPAVRIGIFLGVDYTFACRHQI
jgi:hypothetical protein